MVNSRNDRPGRANGVQWAAFAGSIAAVAVAFWLDATSFADTAYFARIYAAQLIACCGVWAALTLVAFRSGARWRWLLLLASPLMALYAIRAVGAAFFGWSEHL